MKEKITVILLTLALLAGCQSQTPAAPADPSTADTPDMEEIIQQSVDEAVQEKMKEYEEEQRKKNEEIARLKDQLEDLTASSGTSQEVSPEEADAGLSTPGSQPEEATPSRAEVPSQPEPEPPPQSAPAPKKTAPSSSGGGFDLKSLYPDYVWEDQVEETEEEACTASHLPDEALEVIRLTNIEREDHGLEPLPIDEDLMELARVRAEETSELYSHTRPDGTTVVDLRYGENIGQRASAKEQVAAWMNSEGHRTNILLDRYHHIGAACYQAENGNLYWVQVFSLD